MTISGENFAAGAKVTIGGVAGANVTVANSSLITATTGQHTAGVADVIVTVGDESAKLADAFTFVSPGSVINTPPRIVSLSAQGTRVNEPSQFADLSEGIIVTTVVQDVETPVQQLVYEWTSSAGGSFIGTGSTVTWRAPSAAPTPQLVTLSVAVVERYTDVDTNGLPVTRENRVTKTTSVSFHDSVNEVGTMARQFLLDFSDSSIKDVPYIMRNFKTGVLCPSGAMNETSDVESNRLHFKIISSFVGPPAVTVNFGGSCPFRLRRGDACAPIMTDWVSIYLDDGSTQHVAGTDQVTAFYVADDKRWWLCDSDYDGHSFLNLRHSFIR